jgi:hypothetical protein
VELKSLPAWYNTRMEFKKVKIATFVPLQNAEQVREALGKAGAGRIGGYSFCSYSVTGKGQFIPGDNTNPHIGEKNRMEVVEEERIEVVCDRDNVKEVIAALKQAHPYEEVAFDIVPVFTEDQL